MVTDEREMRERAAKWREANVYKLREGVKTWPLTADEFDDYLAAFAIAERDAEREHERQRAVEICDLALERMIDRDACARAIRNPETKYPSMPRSRVAAKGEK